MTVRIAAPINERMPTEETLRTSELRYRRLFEAARDGILILDANELKITDVNPFMTELLGYTRAEFIGRELWELGFFEDKRASKAAFRTLQADGYLRYDDLPLETKEGEARQVEFVSNVYDEGDVKVIQCNIRDLTQRKELEARTSAIEEGYRKLFEFAPDGIIIASPDNYYLDANPGMCRMLGYKRAELIGMHAADIVSSAAAKHLDSALAEVKTATEYSEEWEFRRKDGSKFTGEVIARIMPDGNLLAMIRDISERKAVEEKLDRSQSNLARAQQIAHLGSWEMDLPLNGSGDASPLRWSDEVFRIFGYQPGEIEVSNENFFKAAHPDDRENIRAAMAKALRAGDTYNVDHRILLPDGTERIVHEHSEIVCDEITGEPFKMIGTVQDITERRRIEEQLAEAAASNAESLALIDTILANAPIGFAFQDRDLRYVRINETLAAINGLSVEDHLGRTLIEILPEMSPILDPIMREVIDTGKPVVDFEFSGETQAEPGLLKHWLVSFYPVRMKGGEVLGVGVLVSEVTERKKAEDELRESEERFAGAFELAPIGVALVLPDGKWLKVNRALCEITGYAESELLEMTFQDITHADDVRSDVLNSRRLLRGKIAHYQMEKRYIHKLGHIVFVSINVSLVRDGDGKPLYFIAQIQDVTDRKRAEEELRESEYLLASSQRITHLGSWVINLDAEGKTHTEHWSDEHYRIYGFKPGEIEITEEVFFNSVHPDDRERLASTVRESIEHKKPFNTEHRIILPDGSERTVHAVAEVVLDGKTGIALKLLGSVQDITERKNAEAALMASEERYRSVVETAPDVIVTIDDASTICFINPAAEKIFGYTIDEMKGSSLTMLMPERLRPMHTAGIERYQTTGVKHASWDYLELIGLHKSGREIPITISFSEYIQNGRRFFTGIIRDVSERKAAMIALEESEERNRELVENAIDIIYTHDLEGTYTSVNKAGERITGYTLDESLAMNIADTVAPEYLAKARKMIAEKLAGNEITAYEIELVAKDGHRVSLEVNTRVIYDDDVPVGLQGIARDITERKKVQEALRESEERYRELVENAIDVIYTLDLEGNYTSMNRAGEGVTGYTVEESLKRNIVESMAPEYRERAKQLLAAQVHGEDLSAFELEIVAKDGRRVALEIKTRPIKENGVPVGVQGIARDITERKRTEAALAESEAGFKSLFDAANDAIMVLNEGLFIDCNARTEAMFGCTKDWIIGRDPVELSPPIQPDGRTSEEKVLLHIVPAMQGIPQFFEWQHLRKDGTLFDAEVSLNKVDFQGETHVQAIVRDVTERKRADAELQETNRRIEDIVNSVEGIVWEADAQTFVFTFVSTQAEQVLGYPARRWIDEPTFWSEHIHPDDRDGAVKFCVDSTNKLMPHEFEYRMLAEDGRYVWIKDTVTVLAENGRAVKLRGIMMDITDRKKAETLLLESKEQLTLAAASVNLGIWDWDVVENKLVWDDRMYELYGIREQDFSGAYDAWQKGLHPDDREQGDANIQAALRGETQFKNEFRVVWPNGEVHYIEAHALVERSIDGTPRRMIGVNWDITERKRSELELGESERRFSDTLQNLELVSVMLDRDARITYCNDYFLRLTGWELDELLGRDWFETFLPSNDLDELRRVYSELLANQPAAWHYENEIVTRTSTRHLIRWNNSVLRSTSGDVIGTASIGEDITEQKMLEEQLRQSQKMEAVGVLAGGIAHDFNNLLTAINGYSDLTLKKMAPDDPLRRNIEEVKNAGSRAAELTSQLLAFSRKQVLRTTVLSLNTVISNIENMLRRIIRESVELRVILDPDLANVKGDAGQIEQVIMNLAINARDAMPDGGTLTIRTQNIFLDDDYASRHLAVTPGEFIRLTVTDTGEGMDAAVQSHIFEPFFTTKDVDKGTGLGLATVYGIVKQSGGDIEVYSEVGHGTTFKIYLPSVDESVKKARWTGERERPSRGTETVLVVEDEEIVRKLVCEVLASDGYTVLEASEAKAALEIVETYGKTIHMLLTDVIMPKIGGSELKDHIVKLRPDIKVLFMSGYTDDAIAHRGIYDADIAFIEKPFTPNVLLRKIRSVLEVSDK